MSNRTTGMYGSSIRPIHAVAVEVRFKSTPQQTITFYFYALNVIVSAKQVPDGLEEWRLDLAMPKVLENMRDHRGDPFLTEQVMDAWQTSFFNTSTPKCSLAWHVRAQGMKKAYFRLTRNLCL